jgi:hypothetical protein
MARSRDRRLSSYITRSDINLLRHLRLNHGAPTTPCLRFVTRLPNLDSFKSFVTVSNSRLDSLDETEKV